MARCGTADNCGSCPIYNAGLREKHIVGVDSPMDAAERLGAAAEGCNDDTITREIAEGTVSALGGYQLGGAVELLQVAVARRASGDCQEAA